MKPARYNITGQKAGSRVQLPLAFCDENETLVSLAGYSAVMKIAREDFQGVTQTVTSAAGEILIGGATFNVILDFDLKLRAGTYVYDLVLINASGAQLAVMTGAFEVEASAV